MDPWIRDDQALAREPEPPLDVVRSEARVGENQIAGLGSMVVLRDVESRVRGSTHSG